MELKVDYNTIIKNLTKLSSFKSQKEMVSKIAEWLNLSETSIYNKISGRSHFSVEELFVICIKSRVSLDFLMYNATDKHGYVQFFADGLKYKPRNFNDYLSNIIGHYTKVKQLTGVTGYFLANELPLYHYLEYPSLVYLKLYIWNKINWQISGISADYNFTEFKANFQIQQEIVLLKSLFNSFSNVEIWNPNMLDNTLAQFNYLREVNIINHKDDIFQINKEFRDLVNNLEELTITGLKSENPKGVRMQCEIFITDLNLGSEVILVKSDQYDMLFQQIDVPNYMQTMDDRMVRNQFNYFENIRKISTLITKASEKERLIYFSKLREQLKKLPAL